MTIRLRHTDNDFSTRFAALLSARESSQQDVAGVVAGIIADVRARGDAALAEYTQRFDRVDFTKTSLRISAAEMAQAEKNCPPEVKKALEHAAVRIRDYHAKQRPADLEYTDAGGTKLGWKWNAIDAVGLYVPGGQASYPSSVLMNAVPAKVAGVKRLAMVVPTPNGAINSAVLVAARIAGVDEMYRIGGAQAVAALACGTETIPAVDKIVGPGNAYVAEAKRQVFGRVGIDMIAGPSEILVVADAKNNPAWIAADLLSQAEHDADAQSILITDDAAFADAVEAGIQTLLKTLPRAEIAGKSWNTHGAIIIVRGWGEAVPLINQIAPEHLELAVDAPETLAAQVCHAGAIFLGRYTPEAVGDYLAGPSHVLPTSRTARFSSGLGVLDFMKRTSIIGCTANSLRALMSDGDTLAQAEGLHAHGLSLTRRK